MKNLVLYADIKRFIGLIHSVLEEPDNIKFMLDSFCICDGFLCLPYYNEDNVIKILHIIFHGYELKSLSNVERSQVNKISLRIIINQKFNDELSIFTKFTYEPKNVVLEMQKVLFSGKFKCNCSQCLTNIINSDNAAAEVFWHSESTEALELAEMSWCLCGCVNDHIGTVQHFKDRECYVISEKFINIQNYFSNDGNMLHINKDTVECKICGTRLGFYSETSGVASVKLRLSSISIVNKDNFTLQIWPDSSEEFELAFSNFLLLKENVNKFIIGSKNNENELKHSLMICLLEDDATFFFKSWNYEDIQIVDLHGTRCVRVMINFCESKSDDNKNLALKWMHDFSVEIVELPIWKIIMLRRILENNSGMLPFFLNTELNFKISFLRR